MTELNSCEADWLSDLFKCNLIAPKQSPTPYARSVYFVTLIIGWSTRLRENIATSRLSKSRLATRHCCDQSPPRLTTPQIAQSLRLVAANAIPAGNREVHQETANTTTTTTTGFNFYGSLYDEFICEPGGGALVGFCVAFLLFSPSLTDCSIILLFSLQCQPSDMWARSQKTKHGHQNRQLFELALYVFLRTHPRLVQIVPYSTYHTSAVILASPTITTSSPFNHFHHNTQYWSSSEWINHPTFWRIA